MESSPESPVPVRKVAFALSDWIGRLGRIWVEGQVTQITNRPGQPTCFLVLRDTAADMSLQVACKRSLLEDLSPPLADGARVVVWGQPEYRPQRGTLSFTAYDVRPVGIGALLARLEQLKSVLGAEGLFAPERKKRLPFLPRTVGLVTGRASAAERDVVDNARRRWPGVQFRVENVVVQGPYAVTEMIAALERLDRDPEVDVIVLARGGGSLEDLLPFSDESLVRAVAKALTPVVTAVGHETDSPLVDLVADRRASTPTDAAKLVVPDVREELDRVTSAQARIRRCITSRLDTEARHLSLVVTRPSLADPHGVLAAWSLAVDGQLERARRAQSALVASARTTTEHLAAQLSALSPQATLDRGYAVLQRSDGAVVRDADDVTAGEALDARVARGRFAVVVS